MSSIRFCPTPDDLLAAYRLKFVTAVRSRRVIRTYLIGGLVLAGLSGVAAWQWDLAPVGLAAVIGLGYWIALLSLIFLSAYLRLPRQVRRIYFQQKALHAETTVTWSAAGITFDSDRGRSHFDWSDFIRGIAGAEVIILYQSEALINFIPTRALSVDQVDEIVGFFRT